MNNTVKLFCVPYSGASAMVYLKWRRSFLEAGIDIQPLELAGRGGKSAMPFYENMEEAVEDLLTDLQTSLKGQEPYALWGHSLGSILVFELAHAIRQRGLHAPQHLFFTGDNPPGIKSGIVLHNLDLPEFKEEIIAMGATDASFFEDEEMLAFYLPVLRSDLKLAETYTLPAHSSYLNVPVAVINGNTDKEIVAAEMHRWNDITQKECMLYELEGGHFFINSQIKRVLEIIKISLSRSVTAGGQYKTATSGVIPGGIQMKELAKLSEVQKELIHE